jgi:hypothetical protein
MRHHLKRCAGLMLAQVEPGREMASGATDHDHANVGWHAEKEAVEGGDQSVV